MDGVGCGDGQEESVVVARLCKPPAVQVSGRYRMRVRRDRAMDQGDLIFHRSRAQRRSHFKPLPESFSFRFFSLEAYYPSLSLIIPLSHAYSAAIDGQYHGATKLVKVGRAFLVDQRHAFDGLSCPFAPQNAHQGHPLAAVPDRGNVCRHTSHYEQSIRTIMSIHEYVTIIKLKGCYGTKCTRRPSEATRCMPLTRPAKQG